jgi:iron complex transport system permease protein
VKRLLVLVVLLLVTALLSLAVGSANIHPVDVVTALFGGNADRMQEMIITEIRLPRTLLAILVGSGIAACGASIQGLFRNPLADPALIGVSSGAALFAAAYLVLGAGLSSLLGLTGSAFAGGLLTTWLVLEVGRRGGTISAMLLAGVAVNALAIAGIGLLSYMSTDIQLRSVAFWALGSLNGADWRSVALASAIPVLVLLLFRERQNLNAITLGDQEASYLGVSVPKLRIRVVVLTALAVSIGVSLTGVIAFVGLVVPHLIRLTLGSTHQIVIPGSALLGGLLLLVADTMSRTLFAPAEVPVGILTSLIGGPFFILMIMQQKGKLGI